MQEKKHKKEIDLIIEEIDSLTAKITEYLNHSEELTFRDYDRLMQRIRLFQITDF